MTKAIRDQAREKGIRLTYDKGKKRVRKTPNVLLKEIQNHDNKVLRDRMEQTKNMLRMCKSIISNSNSNVVIKKKNAPLPPPPPPPPPPPMMMQAVSQKPKGVVPPPPPPPPKKKTLVEELRNAMNKKNLKKKSNKNAKITVA